VPFALAESYILEALPHFISFLNQYDVFGEPPDKYSLIISVLQRLIADKRFAPWESFLAKKFNTLKVNYEALENALQGKPPKVVLSSFTFPMLDLAVNGNHSDFLESLSVVLQKAKEANFVIINSGKENDSRIKQQAETAWALAEEHFFTLTGKHPHPHSVIISFGKNFGAYSGDSFGVALLLAMMEKLFLFYNAPFTFSALGQLAFTGSIQQKGNVGAVGEENIIRKVASVFFSERSGFIIPKEDEPAAEKKLRELKKEYPNRNLKLIAISDIENLLTRRNVVDIKRHSIIKRTGKTVVKNKLVSALLVLLLLLLASFYFYQYDDNPYGFEPTPNGFNIVNQSGKMLWTIKSLLGAQSLVDPSRFELKLRVLDLDNDKKNEVIYCFNSDENISDKKISEGIAFFNYKGKIFNKLTFTKTVYSKREKLIPPYSWALQDTFTFKGRRSLLACANNAKSYASAALIIDLKTQQIIGDTLWNCGAIMRMRSEDFDDDGEKEIVGIAMNNGKERSSLFYLDLSKFRGQIPSTDEYTLINIKQAEVNKMFLLPKTDFAAYNLMRWSGLFQDIVSINKHNRIVSFGSTESSSPDGAGISYNWKFNTSEFLISIGGMKFRVERDSLVAQGKLQKPFTDTWEYRQLIHDQILQWNGKDFVPITNSLK